MRSVDLQAASLPCGSGENIARPDEKIITAWNGMTVSALAKAGQAPAISRKPKQRPASASPGCREPMAGCAEVSRMSPVRYQFLEDYAYFIVRLVDLYKAALEPFWLDAP